MYTTKCFIRKSNKDINDKIYKLGYRTGTGLTLFDNPKFYSYALLVACSDYYCSVDNENGNDKKLINQGFIDCKDNENLFLAIAALRDDSDKNQWFVDVEGEDWLMCTTDNIKDDPVLSWDQAYLGFHKASADELINYFLK